MKRSKLYRSRLEKVDRTKFYSLEEGVKVLKSMPSSAKFDETVELSFRLGIDPKQSDQIVRGAMVLPQGTGKEQRVVVIAEGEFALKAKEAGADEVGYEELIQRMKGGWLDFDVLIATPAAMKEVRTLGRVLGPRGLMPNPKTGTMTAGKLSFSGERLVENLQAIFQTIMRARPAAAKGVYLKSWTLSSTMSPGIRLDIKVGAKA